MTTQSPLIIEFGPEFDAMQKKLDQAGPELIAPALTQLLTDAALLGTKVAREGAPRDTAALIRSIQSEVRPLSARVYTPLTYALTMEEGRRPGAKMPPPDALVGWIRRHGLTVSPFVLARSIARRGIRGRFFMKAAKQAVQGAMPRFISEAAARIQARWKA